MPRKPRPTQEKPSKPARKVRKVRQPKGGRNWRGRFLKALADNGGEYLRACRKAGVSQSTMCKHRREDPAFDAACDEACAESVSNAVAEIYRRGVQGYERPVFFAGEKVGTERVYADGLLLQWVRAHRKEFREKTEITGANGSPLVPAASAANVTLTYDHDQFARQFEQFTRGDGLAGAGGAAAGGAGGGGVGRAAADGAGQPVDPQDAARQAVPQPPAGGVPRPPG